MNHLEENEFIIFKITPEYIKWIEEENKKYDKANPQKYPYITLQVEKEKNSIRHFHRKKYSALQKMFPDAVIHHQWIEKTSKYEGVAIVDRESHQHNSIKIIKTLEGKITKFKHEF